MAIIGFTKTAYVVEEGKEVDVCVEVKSPNVTCPFDIRIDVQLSTMDDTASENWLLFSNVICL